MYVCWVKGKKEDKKDKIKNNLLSYYLEIITFWAFWYYAEPLVYISSFSFFKWHMLNNLYFSLNRISYAPISFPCSLLKSVFRLANMYGVPPICHVLGTEDIRGQRDRVEPQWSCHWETCPHSLWWPRPLLSASPGELCVCVSSEWDRVEAWEWLIQIGLPFNLNAVLCVFPNVAT